MGGRVYATSAGSTAAPPLADVVCACAAARDRGSGSSGVGRRPGRISRTVGLTWPNFRIGLDPPTFRFSGGDGDLLAAEARVKGGVNQVVALRQKVPVGVDGCGDRLMSKALLDVREGHTGGDEPGDVGVP